MDARRTGIAMVIVGVVGQLVGVIAGAINSSDAAIFDLSTLPHAIFFSGIMVALLGVAMIFLGPWIYAGERTPVRNFAQVLVPFIAVASIAGCAAAANGSSLADGKKAPKNAKAATVTTVHDMAKMTEGDGHSHDATGGTEAHDMESMGTVIAATADGTSACEKSSPKPASPGQVGAGSGGGAGSDAEGGHGHRGMVKQLPVTNAQRKLLIEQMRQARTVIDRYPTVKDALAAGYDKSTPFVPCIGAHYTNLGLIAKFDPAAPSELLYDGTDPDSKIVGLSYLVLSPGGPPEGFAGPNDHYHQHNANGGLCLDPKNGVIGGENTTEKECIARGGKKAGGIMANIWMGHAWVAPGWECSWGVFAGECPELGGKLGGNAFSN